VNECAFSGSSYSAPTVLGFAKCSGTLELDMYTLACALPVEENPKSKKRTKDRRKSEIPVDLVID